MKNIFSRISKKKIFTALLIASLLANGALIGLLARQNKQVANANKKVTALETEKSDRQKTFEDTLVDLENYRTSNANMWEKYYNLLDFNYSLYDNFFFENDKLAKDYWKLVETHSPTNTGFASNLRNHHLDVVGGIGSAVTR